MAKKTVYGNSGKLFRQSEVDASVCCLYKDTGTGLEQLPGDSGSRIVFRLVNKELVRLLAK